MHIKPQASKNNSALERKIAKRLLAMGRTSQPQSPTSNPVSSQGIGKQHKNDSLLSPSQNAGLFSVALNSDLSLKESKKQLLDLKTGLILLKATDNKKKIVKHKNADERNKKMASKTDKPDKKVLESKWLHQREVELTKKLEKSEKRNEKRAEAKKPLKNDKSSECKEGVTDKLKKMLNKVQKSKEKIELSANYNKKRRVHRMASLNALAKVHILYENDSRCSPSDGSETENLASDVSNVGSLSDGKTNGMFSTDSCKAVTIKNESKSPKSAAPKKNRIDQNCSESSKPKASFSKKDKSGTEKNGEDATAKKLEKNPKVLVKKKKEEKKSRKRKAICDVEIIDTKACKRLACLNAQAILAASCLPDRSRKISDKKICKVDEILINEKEIMTYNREIVTDQSITTQVTNHQQTCTTVICQKPAAKQSAGGRSIHHNLVQTASRVADARVEAKSGSSNESSESAKAKTNNKICKLRAISTPSEVGMPGEVEAAVSKMGVTAEYTEVTKVQINTTKAMQVKEECKAKRTTIERILEKDDVAITRMYHYQTKGTSQSYCVKMHTTYKPSSNKSFPTPPPAEIQNKTDDLEETPEIISTTVVHGDPGYYNYNPPNPQNFSMNQNTVARVNGVPVVSVSPIVRHYSSAFTVPQYGASSPSHVPQNSYSQEYNKSSYYPQAVQDPLMVHKPIPYHPPQSPPHSSQQPSHHPPAHHALPPQAHQTNSSHPYPPPAHSSYSAQDPYVSYNPPHGYHQMDSNPSHHGAYSRVSPLVANSPYPSQEVTHPQPAHYHPFHHRSHHPTYPPPALSPNSVTSSPSPSYHSANHGSPYVQRHIYSSPSPNYQHQDYSNGPVYTVLSPVPMGTKKSNHLQQRISQAVVSPGAVRCDPHSPDAVPKAEPTVPLEVQNNFQPALSGNGNYSAYHQPAYPSADSVRLKPTDRSNVAGVTPVVKNAGHSTTGNARNDHCGADCFSIEQKFNSKGQRDFCSHRTTVRRADDGRLANADASRKAKTACHFTRVRNAGTMADEQSGPRRLRAATMAATNSSLIAQRQNQQLSLDRVVKCSPSSQAASSVASVKKKVQAGLQGSPSAPIEIDLTLTETPVEPPDVISEMSLKKSKKNCASESLEQLPEPKESLCPLLAKKRGVKKFSNGWSWEGEPYEKLVFHSNDDPPVLRRCYPAMRHIEGDLIHARDCVLLKSGPRKIDLPFVAKVTALWETPDEGEMMISLLWYYRPEHTEQGRRPIDLEDEIFASKHRDVNSVACIEDKCYVLTSAEYCRYRSRLRMFEDSRQPGSPVVPELEDGYPRKCRLPPGRVSPEMVFVCRKVYDFRQKRLLKNPV